MVAAISWALFSNLTRLWAAPENSGAMVLFLPATGVILLILSLATAEESSWTGAGHPGDPVPGRRHGPVLRSLGHRHEKRRPRIRGRLFLFHSSSFDPSQLSLPSGLGWLHPLARLSLARRRFSPKLGWDIREKFVPALRATIRNRAVPLSARKLLNTHSLYFWFLNNIILLIQGTPFIHTIVKGQYQLS